MTNEELLNKLTEVIEVNSKLTNLIHTLRSDITTPPAPVTPPAQLTMTAAANGMTYEQYKEAGWSDQQMIDGGIATAPTTPAAPPAPTTPPAPAAVTPEALNEIMVAEFNRLGDRAPIDAELKKLGVNGVAELPAEKYQELINNVKALVKAV